MRLKPSPVSPGLALLFLLDVGDLAFRLYGAAIYAAAIRGQMRYWLARVALIVAAVMVLVPGAVALALIVPGTSRVIFAGIGAMVAFAGAIGADVVRREP